jgi:uncharacterized membrane protein
MSVKRFSKGSFWHHHRLSSRSALPLFDSVFAVAVTLLAFSVPDKLGGADWLHLLSSVFVFQFIGVAVLLFWFKFRRLIALARLLNLFQLVLMFLGLLTVVLIPRMAELVLRYGAGMGSLGEWTLSQTVNVNFLTALFLLNLFTLLFVISLRRQGSISDASREEIRISLRAQLVGFLLLCVLAVMELFLPWFNDEFIIVVPIVLLFEEFLVARQFSRGFVARSCHLPPPPPPLVDPGQRDLGAFP